MRAGYDAVAPWRRQARSGESVADALSYTRSMPVSLPPRQPAPLLEALGDCAWLLRFADALQPEANARVHACAAWLGRELGTDGVELVPAFASLAVHFEPARREHVEIRVAIEHALVRWLDSDEREGPHASRV